MAFQDIAPYLGLISDSNLRELLNKFHSKYLSQYQKVPASTSHHHKWVGGYLDHVSQVVFLSTSLFDFITQFYNKVPFTKDDVIVVAYFHDLEKIFKYKPTTEEWKRKKGIMWDVIESSPQCDDSAKVVQMCAIEGIILTDIQIEAISLHHGGWSNRLSSVYSYPSGEFPPLASLVNAADMISGSILGHDKDVKLSQG